MGYRKWTRKMKSRETFESRQDAEFRVAGGLVRPDNDPGSRRGRHSLVISVGGKKGGGSSLPGTKWGYYVKNQMTPINVPPAIIYDANGTPIAKIVVDPVTGERSRVPFKEVETK